MLFVPKSPPVRYAVELGVRHQDINMSVLNIRVLNKEDWAIYKDLRLLSLQDSPDSFGSTYEQEVQVSNEEWISRLDPELCAKYALPLMAELNGVAIGLA